MKKILIACSMLLGISLAASAQTQTPAAAPAKKQVTAKHAVAATESAKQKTQHTTAAVKQAEKKTETAAVQAKTTGPLKKDGTPDKRYKENKQMVHVKKDGTADKRFKENKAAAKKPGTEK
ncbi:MAG: hypothetical protein QM781_10980 [Chitinophagaceae bacterium]